MNNSIIEKAITAKSWKKVLMIIYRFSPNQIGDSNKIHRYSDLHPLAKKLKISGQELGNTIAFLEDQDLIESLVSVGSTSWKLSKKGFEVALELEKQERSFMEGKRSKEMQLSIVFLTFLIALTGIANFAIEVFPEYKPYFFYFYCVFIIGFLFGIIIKNHSKFSRNGSRAFSFRNKI